MPSTASRRSPLWPLLLVCAVGCQSDATDTDVGSPPPQPVPGDVGTAAPEPAPAEPRAPFEEAVEPLVMDHCYACHSSDDPTDGVALDLAFDEADVRSDWRLWRRVLRELEAGTMPPRNRPRPDEAQVARAIDWLRPVIDEQAAATPIHPGRVTLRRLTRNQYDRTVRDLFGIDFAPGQDFPADDVGYGFDSIGDVLTLPPLLFESYLTAAETISERVIVVEDPDEPEVRTFPARDLDATARGGLRRDGARTLSTNGIVHVQVSLPREGTYRLSAVVAADQAGPERARAALFHGRTRLVEEAVEVGSTGRQTIETEFRGVAGPQAVAVAFLNDYWNPDAKDPADRDRNLVVHELRVVGPVDVREGPLVQPNPAVLAQSPEPGTERDAIADLARRTAERCWRRPVEEAEVTELASLGRALLDDGEPYERAARLVLQAVLVSPHFLFRVERVSDPDDRAAIEPVTDHELAVRLSYFLHGSAPDAELRALADAGELRDRLDDEIDRLLASPRSVALTEDFAAQWLGLRRLADHAVDPERFPELTPELRDSMREETEHLFEEVVAEDLPVRHLLTAKHTYLDQRLAAHYGFAADDVAEGMGDDGAFRRVAYPPEANGSGLLRHAAILTITSYPTRTSPVKRGKWLMEEILGEPPPPPPPGVGDLPEDEASLRATSLRERLAEHRARPECAVCHDEMDTLGLALERFDPIGRYRTASHGHPIDAVVVHPDGRELAGLPGLRDDLLRGTRFERCVAEKLLIFAIGRGLSDEDEDAVLRILERAEREDFRFSALVRAVVHSPLFLMKSGEDPR